MRDRFLGSMVRALQGRQSDHRRLSKEFSGKVNFYKVNTDDEQELAAAFGIRSIPSLLFVPLEGKLKMMVGALPEEALRKAVQQELMTAAQPSSAVN